MQESATQPLATVPCPFCLTLNRVDLSKVANRPKCGECGRPILLDRPIKLSDSDLERVIRDSSVPLLVDFYADWCGPCKVMAPLLDEVAGVRAGEVLIGKLDTDRNPAASTRYQIHAIPTLIAFGSGREVARETGAVPRARVEALIEAAATAR